MGIQLFQGFVAKFMNLACSFINKCIVTPYTTTCQHGEYTTTLSFNNSDISISAAQKLSLPYLNRVYYYVFDIFNAEVFHINNSSDPIRPNNIGTHICSWMQQMSSRLASYAFNVSTSNEVGNSTATIPVDNKGFNTSSFILGFIIGANLFFMIYSWSYILKRSHTTQRNGGKAKKINYAKENVYTSSTNLKRGIDNINHSNSNNELKKEHTSHTISSELDIQQKIQPTNNEYFRL